MRTFLAACVLVSAALATNVPSYGHGSSGSYFSAHELAKLEEYLHRIASEKMFLREKVNSLKSRKEDLLAQLNNLDMTTLPGFDATQDTQNNLLDGLRADIKAMSHTVGDLEATASGESAVAKAQNAQSLKMSGDIIDINNAVQEQSASLSSTSTALTEAKDKLNQKLTDATDQGNTALNGLISNTQDVAGFSNTRHCASDVVTVDVVYETASGSANVSLPAGLFDMPPSVFCGVLGFVSKPNIDQNHQGYGYGYPDDRQNLAVTLDCEPFTDRVDVRVFDQSRGQGNSLLQVTVQVKACTFGDNF